MFSFILSVSSETSRNRAVTILNISASVLKSRTLHGVIIARYDVILSQSHHMHLYNHLINYTKTTFILLRPQAYHPLFVWSTVLFNSSMAVTVMNFE